jgi:hypoxanthine phosphoribosyltransferase
MPTNSPGDFIHHLDDPSLGPVVVGEKEIQARIAELGDQITTDYATRPPLLVGVLKGAFVFMADLARAIRLPVEIDFMAVSSYGASTRSSGVVRIVKDLDVDLAGRHVILVEDIVDSGLTLTYLRRNLAARHPASLAVRSSCGRATRRPTRSCATSASRSRPPSCLATASTSPSGSATFPTCASSRAR